MALKPCRECHMQVSDGAKTCPHCGIKKPVRGRVSALWIIPAFIVIAAVFGSKDQQPSTSSTAPATATAKDTKPARKPLDYSKPVVTVDYAIICPQGLFLSAAMDNRVNHGIDKIYDVFTSVWNRSAKIKELGCEEWRGGIRVFAHRMASPFNDFVAVSQSPNDMSGGLFTMEPYLENAPDVTPTRNTTAEAATVSDEIKSFKKMADEMYAKASAEDKKLLDFFKVEEGWVSPAYFCGSRGCDEQSQQYEQHLEKNGWSFVYARDQIGIKPDDVAFTFGRWMKK